MIILSNGQPHYIGKPFIPDIEVIARALAHINRFTGHGGTYSVAQHCVLMSARVERHLAFSALLHDAGRCGPTNGFWRDADWLGCRDGKWRPVEPGTRPLAHGAAARVGRLRAYGNALNAYQAEAFITAYLESI